MPLLVGLDVGTTSAKAVVTDLDGRELTRGRAPVRWQLSADGTEIGADSLLDSARLAICEALAAAPGDEFLGLGVASMAESGVLLDRRGQPVGPVIAWHDTRDAREVAEAGSVLGADEYARRTGLPLRSQWAFTKHRWLVTHEPAMANAARRLNVAEWVVRSLGGEEASEQSLASRTGWLDLATRDWWTAATEWSGARPGLLPPLATAGTPLGRVTADACIPALTGAVLTVAGHDHQAGAIGAGATGPGDELDSCGTAEALLRTVREPLDPQSVLSLTQAGITVGRHALPGHWCLLAATQGGLVMQRVLGMLGVRPDDRATLDTAVLTGGAPASRAATGPAPEISLTGESLVNVLGIGDGVTPADIWQATLRTVTAQARRVHDAMTAVVGKHRELVVTGGWACSEAFLRMKRDSFGTLSRPLVNEAGARGAALLAGIAAGVYPDIAQLPAPEYRYYSAGPEKMPGMGTDQEPAQRRAAGITAWRPAT